MSSFERHDETRARRMWMMSGALTVLFLVAVIRLFDLQVMRADASRLASDHNRFRKEVLRAQRGRILDREGRLLVDNFASFVVTINPHEPALRDRARMGEVLGTLAHTIARDSTSLAETVRRARRRTFLPVRLEQNLTQQEVARVEEANLPGVAIRVEPLRRYPHGVLAAHLLGHVGEISAEEYEQRRDLGYEADDQVGKAAIEERYDRVLHGQNGVRYVEVDAFGRAREFSGVREPVPPTHGSDVVLTIDLDLQRALEEAVEASKNINASTTGRASSVVGGAVAIDVWTGEVLALVSRPAFDPNSFALGLNTSSWNALTNDPRKPLLNRVVQSRYPPGSTFKMIVAAAALDSGLVSTGTTLKPCFGSYRLGSRTFRCWKSWGHETLTLAGAVEQSCDVYFYQLGEMLGVDGIARAARRFHLADRTGIELAGEPQGLVPDARYLTERYGRQGWSGGAALNLSIGQGELLFTPLQLAVYVAAIANGGDRVTPYLVRETIDVSGHRFPIAPPVREPMLRNAASVLERIRNMMERVVGGEKGTGHRARQENMLVAGKTGTSQNPGEDHALFVSYAPADAPHVALVVVLEQRGHGGEVAAPVAGAFWRAYQEWRVRLDATAEIMG